MILDHKPNPERVIDAKQLEELFARGYSTAEVARELQMHKALLSRKINARHSLMIAREKGKARAKNLAETV